MSLLLNVDYNEKDEVKKLGAQWDPDLKKWYVNDRKLYPRFAKWILKGQEAATIACDHIYIIVGDHKCFKCSKETKVIGS